MKKSLRKLVLAAFTLGVACLFLACSSDDSSSSNSLQDEINNGTGVFDLSDYNITEDITLTKSRTIKNGDFNGKTLTVDVKGVTLQNIKNVNIVAGKNIGDGDLTISDSDITSLTVNGGGANSIHISGSTLVTITVAKAGVRVSLEKGTTATEVAITANDVNLQGDSDSKTAITTLKVSASVSSVVISGGTISTVTITNDTSDSSSTNETVITIASDITITKFDESVEKINISNTVSEETKNSITESAGSDKVITVTSATLKKADNIKTSYEESDTFDFTGLSVELVYSDKSTQTSELNSSNTKVSGFNSSSIGEQTVSFIYNGTEVNGTLTITIKKSTKEYKTLLSEGIDLLTSGDYDAGIAKFSAAYNSEKNDETRLYYALSELASISVDSSISKIIKENFGFKEYPNKLNALFSTDWLTNGKYAKTKEVTVRSMVKVNSGFSYDSKYDYSVRVNGNPTSTWRDTKNIRCILDSDGDWLSPESYYDVYDKDENYYLTDVELSKTGKYLISVSYFAKYTSAEDYEEQLNELIDYLYYYDYDEYSHDKDTKKSVIVNYSSVPALNTPSWLKDSAAYKNSLVGTIPTTTTFSWLLISNLLDCNTKGLNSLVDNALNVFGSKYENATTIINEMSSSSVTVPGKLISALGLEEVIGDDTIQISKAEAKLLLSSLEVVKGTLQWISSYDLSVDLSSLAKADSIIFRDHDRKEYLDGDFFSEEEINLMQEIIDAITNLDFSKLFTVRNEKAMTAAKNTFIDAFETALSSYESIKNNKLYPQAVQDALSKYDSIIIDGLTLLKSAINDGTVFYIPKTSLNEITSWPTTKENASFGIDMGKLFTPGYFKDIVERNGKTLQIYYFYEEEFSASWKDKDGIYNYDDGWNYNVKAPIKMQGTVSEIIDNLPYSNYANSLKKYSTYRYFFYYKIHFATVLNKDILAELLPGTLDDYDSSLKCSLFSSPEAYISGHSDD